MIIKVMCIIRQGFASKHFLFGVIKRELKLFLRKFYRNIFHDFVLKFCCTDVSYSVIYGPSKVKNALQNKI